MLCRRSALVVCIAFVLSQTAHSQRPRDFSCLRLHEGLDCLRCAANITVDPWNGLKCAALFANGSNLDGMVCDNLVDALESIAAGNTVHRPAFPLEPCVTIYVYPKEPGAPHIIRPADMNVKLSISANIVISGVAERDVENGAKQPQIKFDAERIASSEKPIANYVFHSNRSQLLGFRNIHFVGSFGAIGVDLVSIVVIEQCIFSNFIQGALDIYNSPTVLVKEAIFYGNGFTAVSKPERYRGHAGGIAIGYDITPQLTVNISNCTFYNNSAELSPEDITFLPQGNTTRPPPPSLSAGRPSRGMNSPISADEAQQVRGEALQDRSFPGRGGGVALIVNSMSEANLLVEDCLFVDNVAVESGGGLYVLLDGLSSHTVTINRTLFSGNLSPSTAGGMQLTFLQEGARGKVHQVFVLNTNFSANQASYGGAVFFLPLTVNVLTLDDGQLGIFTRFENCLFSDNSAVEVGGALGAAFYILAQAAQSIYPLEIVNCTFTRNTVIGGGVVSTAYFPLTFYGKNLFELNQGPSLAIVGSRVRLYGSLLFSSNSNTGSLDGGALYVTSLGQLELTAGATLTFHNNSGTLGASLVVQNPPLSVAFSHLLYNPLCSLIHSDSRSPPDLWNASVNFASNYALVASAVLMNNLDFCSWTQLSAPYFDTARVFRWDFVNYSMDMPNVNHGHGHASDQLFSVQTPAVKLRTLQNHISVFPGENIGLRVVALDELGVATSALFTLSHSSFDKSSSFDENEEVYRFTPSSLNLVKVGSNEPLNVRLRVLNGTPLNKTEKIEAKMISDNQKFVNVKDSFSVSSHPCPTGQRLLGAGDFSECVCDSGDVDIINCERRKVHIEDHLWGVSVRSMVGSSQPENLLVTVACPSHYCLCTPLNTSGLLKCTNIFDESDPNSQCGCNRTGVLCGDCTGGLGFSALLDTCVSCSNAYSTLIVTLVVVDLGIIILILALSKPPPVWLYPVLCHLQLLPYYTTHFPTTFEVVRPYLVYAASALGLYFPYDFCLYKNASPVVVYAFRYIPLLLTVIAIPITIASRKPNSPRNTWHAVTWLLLLIYTPAVHTSMTVLHCPSFPVQNLNLTQFTSMPRWFVNGNIQCFTGAHVALGLVAIVVLVFSVCVMFLPFVAIYAEKRNLSWCRKLCELAVSAFGNSFNYQWWIAVELFRRFILVTMAVWFPRNNYPVIFTLFVLTGVIGFIKPYSSKNIGSGDKTKKGYYEEAVNILEIFLSSNILTLLLLRNTESVEEDYEKLPGAVGLGEGYDECSPFNGMTDFAILLTPLYYLPLLMGIVAFVVWVVSITATSVKTHLKTNKATLTENSTVGHAYYGRGDVVDSRSRTQTIIDISTYNPDDPLPPESSIKPPAKSFNIRTSSKRWKLRGSKHKNKNKEEIELKGKISASSFDMKPNTSVPTEDEGCSFTEI